MILYEWYFSDLLIKPYENNLKNVLYIVHWQLKGTAQNGVFADQRGSCSLPSPTPENFVEFELLTKTTVEQWVELSMGYIQLNALKKSIEEQIEFQVNPPFIAVSAPWESNNE